jgi:hypothetical protein
MEIDHVVPLVPLDKAFADMTMDELIDRCWCELEALAAVCKPCHKVKSKRENSIRRLNKKDAK